MPDYSTRQQVLSHKVARMVVKLDDAHQDLSNAIVVTQNRKASTIIIKGKPQEECNFSANYEILYHIDGLFIHGSYLTNGYMNFVTEALEMEDTIKNYEIRDATG
ncbi:hypothetical protein Tco_1519014, partial [Tanacetum coccineum]